MREIEFRGINNETGEFVYGWYTKLQEGARIFDAIISIVDGEFTRFYIHDAKTIGQFTGLRDKNGVKIFCGDIVRMKWIKTEYVSCVEFVNGAFSISGTCQHFGQMYASCSEVLGNIHQHPHLLEQKK